MANHFNFKATECIEKYDPVKFYKKLWDINLQPDTGTQPAHPEKTGVCLAAGFYWLYECIRLRHVKNNWKDMTGTDVCELRKIYELQHDYEKELPKGSTFGNEVMLMEGLWGLTYPEMRLQIQLLVEADTMDTLKNQSCFTDSIMPYNSGLLMAITPRKENSDGHAIAFYKSTEGEIFFFDVETGCYKIHGMYEFLIGNTSYSYGLVSLKAQN